MMAHEKHRARAPKVVGFYIVTASTSRYAKMQAGQKFTDKSGDLAERIVLQHGHRVVGRRLISDNEKLLKSAFEEAMSKRGVDAIIFTGGTGVSPTDITVETIRPFMQKELTGFGEILRMKSYRRIGPAAMLTRATAGLVKGRLVMCLPGSPHGVRTALNLLMRDIPHVIAVARGQTHGHASDHRRVSATRQ